MEIELLKKIVQNTEPKQSFQIVLTDNKTNFNTKFNPALVLDSDKSYEIALINLETYYSFPNIDETNNKLVYNADGTKHELKIPEGSYEIESLNEEIQRQLKIKGHDEAIVLSPNRNTLKSIISIKEGYKFNFKEENTLRTVLGFDEKRYGPGIHESEHIVNILSINTIYVNIDIIKSSYINGTARPVVYSFFPNVSPGYKIVENPYNLVYLPLATKTIDHVMVKITDQNFKELNLRGETISLRFHVREV